MLNLQRIGGTDRRILRIIKHPKFIRHYYDVALVILDQSYIFDEDIQPVCLPQKSSTSADFMSQFTVTIQGWGKEKKNGPTSSQLTQVDLTVRSRENCNNKYKKMSPALKAVWLPNLLITSMFCADGNLRSDVGTCYGDSGGPTMIQLITYLYNYTKLKRVF